MDDEELKNYLKSGEIASRVKAFAAAETKAGVKLLELAEKIEAKIRELGAQPAFPVNLSRNDEAAHFTPSLGDVSFTGEKDVLKVDFGCHVEGCIADVAFTV
ncbi:MAG: M24 family metallopeptidase, partial [Candidatus Micrarchaeota archaeon]